MAALDLDDLDNLENLGFEKGGTTMDIWLVSFIWRFDWLSVYGHHRSKNGATYHSQRGYRPLYWRWAHSLMRGVFFHKNITETP